MIKHVIKSTSELAGVHYYKGEGCNFNGTFEEAMRIDDRDKADQVKDFLINESYKDVNDKKNPNNGFTWKMLIEKGNMKIEVDEVNE